MAPTVTDTRVATDEVLGLLAARLPAALTVYRRLQFTRLPGGSTPHSHVLLARDEAAGPRHFAAAYLDFSRSPATALFFYSTLEGGGAPQEGPPPAAERELCLDLAAALFARVRRLGEAWDADPPAACPDRVHRGGVMVGGLHEGVRLALGERRGLDTSRYWNPHDRWLFRVEDLPAGAGGGGRPPFEPDPAVMAWDVARREDLPLFVSRTKIPKDEEAMLAAPSTVLRTVEGGTPVAWAFLGVDGSLSTLHCEEPYRGRGIAKAVAIRTIRDNNKLFGDDGWATADVHIDNVASQAVCTSIGGKKAWRVSWTVVDFASIKDT